MYPRYWLRKIGQKHTCLEEGRERELGGVGLDVELTSVGILWRLKKKDYTVASGVPIVMVAGHFKNIERADERIQKLREERRRLEDKVKAIDEELDSLEVF